MVHRYVHDTPSTDCRTGVPKVHRDHSVQTGYMSETWY